MAANANELNELLQKMEAIIKKQKEMNADIQSLYNELHHYRNLQKPGAAGQPSIKPTTLAGNVIPAAAAGKPPAPGAVKGRSDLEKFIGENLTNKIGIAITVIGVAIGAKYSIDNDLISPVTRIVLGYLMGLLLLGIGARLKKHYENFSAVLVSGAMAILYFITFSAFNFFGLFSKITAFGLMLLFTIFTVVAALRYNKQVIAHVGLVGAYAVPFLLSDGSGEVAVLFTYMAIINSGILAIGLLKYWKQLYYSSFSITWLIYAAWFVFNYKPDTQFATAIIFAVVFFAIFYAIFLAYKLRKQELFRFDDVILLLSNSFIFYAITHAAFDKNPATAGYLGLLTAGNAGIHLVVSLIIRNRKLVDRNLFYLVMGLVFIFITIAIPVQLDGNWVTLLWVLEAALLFWIGRSKQVQWYERISYPLMLLAFISLIQDWMSNYHINFANTSLPVTPVWNIHFLTSMIFIGAFLFIWFIHRKYAATLIKFDHFSIKPAQFIAAILLVGSYFAFYVEIASYWNQLYQVYLQQKDAKLPWQIWEGTNPYRYLKTVWIINYSLAYFAIALLITGNRKENEAPKYLIPVLAVFVLLVFLSQGLYNLGMLRELQLAGSSALPGYLPVLRYLSVVLAAFLLFALSRRLQTTTNQLQRPGLLFDLLLHFSILCVVSSEYIHLTELAATSQAYKLGLSILWGVYALFIISLGIWKNKKHLRVGAIILFTITLAKLFFFDIAHLQTVAKTIVLVSLGVLLLIISFLYNKYRHQISKGL